MMKLKQLLLVGFLLVGVVGVAQEITVHGRVKEAVTGKGVKAKVFYKSYPTGGLSGTINDSVYSFNIFGSSKYVITAEAEGHTSAAVLIDPQDANNLEIERDIELTAQGKPIRLNHLIFDVSRAVIKPSSFKELDELVAWMKTNKRMEIQLEGHTDAQGDAAANLKLSQSRVEAVKKYLVSKGIEKDRILTKAFGGTQPLSTENTEAARALNRRVEMRVLKQ